eukprot:gene4157-14256_t
MKLAGSRLGCAPRVLPRVFAPRQRGMRLAPTINRSDAVVAKVKAGFLKILTMASLTQSAPVDAARTAIGAMSQYMLVPGGLLMCYAAKVITEANLQYDKRFMRIFVAVLVFAYFGLYKLLYRGAYAPKGATNGELDDLSYFEGRYPSQIEDDKKQAAMQAGSGDAVMDLDRKPARKSFRKQAPPEYATASSPLNRR